MQRKERNARRQRLAPARPERRRPAAAARANHDRVLDAFVRARRALTRKADRAA